MNENENVFGIVSFVLSLLAVTNIFCCCVGVIPAIMSLIFGIIGLGRKPDFTQKVLSILGIIFSILSFVLIFVFIFIILIFGS